MGVGVLVVCMVMLLPGIVQEKALKQHSREGIAAAKEVEQRRYVATGHAPHPATAPKDHGKQLVLEEGAEGPPLVFGLDAFKMLAQVLAALRYGRLVRAKHRGDILVGRRRGHRRPMYGTHASAHRRPEHGIVFVCERVNVWFQGGGARVFQITTQKKNELI